MTAGHVIKKVLSGKLERDGEHTTMVPFPLAEIRRQFGDLALPGVTFDSVFRRSPLAYVVIEFDYRHQVGMSTMLPSKFKLERAHLAQTVRDETVWSRNSNSDWTQLYVRTSANS